MVITVDGKGERAAADRITARECHRAFVGIPSVIRASDPDVDLFPGVLAYIGDVEIARAAIEARPPGVAQPKGPDLVGSRQADEGIVGRNGVVAIRVAGKTIRMHVEPEHLAQ